MVHTTLRTVFGLEPFRLDQETIICNILYGGEFLEIIKPFWVKGI